MSSAYAGVAEERSAGGVAGGVMLILSVESVADAPALTLAGAEHSF